MAENIRSLVHKLLTPKYDPYLSYKNPTKARLQLQEPKHFPQRARPQLDVPEWDL